MRTVIWPGININKVEIWKVLELSGLVSSSRKAQNFVKSGYVYKDNTPVYSLRETANIAEPFVLSIRFPSGITHEDTIYIVNRLYYEGDIQRREDINDS